MGCAGSKQATESGDGPPHLIYCRLPDRGAHSHLQSLVDLRKLAKLVRGGRLAPLYPHDVTEQDDGASAGASAQECPICTASFPSINSASCCSAHICTECFVYHQTCSDPPGRAQCPFCKSCPFAVRYLGRQQAREQQQQEQQLRRKADQQRLWLSTKQRWRRQQQQELRADSSSSSTAARGQQHHSDAISAAAADAVSRRRQGSRPPPPSSWLERLAAGGPPSVGSSRRVELIRVLAGFSQDGGFSTPDAHAGSDTAPQSPAGPAPAAELGAAEPGHGPYPLQPLDLDQPEEGDGGASASARQDAELDYSYALGHYRHHQPAAMGAQQQQRPAAGSAEDEQRRDQEQQRAHQLALLRLQQVAELSRLAQVGLLPHYAAAELSGLDLEELDEILLEQALMASLSSGAAAQELSGGHQPTPVAVR